MKKIVFAKTDNSLIQFIRYLFVGGISFIADFSVLFVLHDKIGVPLIPASIFAFLTGLTINYFLCLIWVFNQRTYNKKRKELALFFVIGLIALALNTMLIQFFSEVMNIHYLIGKVLTTALVFIWNFLSRKLMLFRTAKVDARMIISET